MSQVFPITKNKDRLTLRSNVLQAVRHFFVSRNFIEIEAPLFVRHAGQEPYLSPVQLSMTDDRGHNYAGYLATSPEFTMKKCLAAGFDKIFYLGKAFRNRESLSDLHHPEFTMLEWYRSNTSYENIMDDTEALVKSIAEVEGAEPTFAAFVKNPWKRIHMRHLWKDTIDVDLNEYLTTDAIRELCISRGYTIQNDDSYENYFHTIFLNEIEPTLGKNEAVIVHHFPSQMAALANVDEQDPRYAKRFEVYMKGMEIANAFDELCDKTEQEKRFLEEQEKRKALGKESIDIDTAFLEAIESIDHAAGIALGFDRVVMLAAGCQNIEDVLVLPIKSQFDT